MNSFFEKDRIRKDFGNTMKKTSTEIANSVTNDDKADTSMSIEHALFRSMDTNNSGFISKNEWIRRLNESGIQSDDIRIKSLIYALSESTDIDFDAFLS